MISQKIKLRSVKPSTLQKCQQSQVKALKIWLLSSTSKTMACKGRCTQNWGKTHENWINRVTSLLKHSNVAQFGDFPCDSWILPLKSDLQPWFIMSSCPQFHNQSPKQMNIFRQKAEKRN